MDKRRSWVYKYQSVEIDEEHKKLHSGKTHFVYVYCPKCGAKVAGWTMDEALDTLIEYHFKWCDMEKEKHD